MLCDGGSDETPKLKLWELKNLNGEKTQNSNCEETQKFELWWQSKTHVVMTLYNSNYDKTQKLKLG